MKIDNLITKIITEADAFNFKNPDVETKKIVVTISIRNGENIIRHLHNLYYPTKREIIYKSLTLYGYRIVFSDTISDNEIVIGIKSRL